MKVNTIGLNVDQIYPGLWQGAYPPEGGYLASGGFRVLVLCAREIQPRATTFPGLEVVYAPNDDDYDRPITMDETRIAINAAKRVARAIQMGKPTLVTCAMGWNRSGLVNAFALHLLTDKSGPECIAHIQSCRRKSLTNPSFLQVLEGIKPRGRLRQYG